MCSQSRIMGVCAKVHRRVFGVYPFFDLLDRLGFIVGAEFGRSRLESIQLAFLLAVEVLVGSSDGEWVGSWIV